MSKDLAKQYDPREVEDRIYKMWLDGKYFHARCEKDKDTYTIVIPPPNITGQLHMGHALDNTLQDILIRFKRMQGFDTLWLPGHLEQSMHYFCRIHIDQFAGLRYLNEKHLAIQSGDR